MTGLFQIPDAATAGSVMGAIAWAYLATNAVRILSYLPQIVTVWRCRDGARAISLWTWGMWTVSHTTAVLYGVVVMHDVFFTLISVINLVGCGTVAIIAARRRLTLYRQMKSANLEWTRA